MRGKISMRKISEVLRQRYELNHSYRVIAKSLNISITTISEYLRRAKLAGIQWPLSEGTSEDALYEKLFLLSSRKTKKRSTQTGLGYTKNCAKKESSAASELHL